MVDVAMTSIVLPLPPLFDVVVVASIDVSIVVVVVPSNEDEVTPSFCVVVIDSLVDGDDNDDVDIAAVDVSELAVNDSGKVGYVFIG
jgi:hypothetical protein